MKKLKQSIDQYRTIKGVRYECFTSNPLEFEACKKECKKENLKYRIIDNQFYKQVDSLIEVNYLKNVKSTLDDYHKKCNL